MLPYFMLFYFHTMINTISYIQIPAGLGLIFLVMSCIPQQKTETVFIPQVSHARASLAQSCLITGEILEVEKIQDNNDTLSICSKAHCYALVKIKQISGCGSSVSNPVRTTDTLRVFFVFSLDPTYAIESRNRQVYPGLKPGDQFESYLEQRMVPGDKMNYRVYSYTLSAKKK